MPTNYFIQINSYHSNRTCCINHRI